MFFSLLYKIYLYYPYFAKCLLLVYYLKLIYKTKQIITRQIDTWILIDLI